jgi:YD repeat-containing protein
MSRRVLEIDGARWEISPSGRVTQYTRDEFGLLFARASGDAREERVVRYSPLGSRSPEASLNELSDTELTELFRRSQPSWTAPETGYRR